MCTQRNMILMLNTAIGQSGRKVENYIAFFKKIISWTGSVNNTAHLHSPLYSRNLTVPRQLFFSCLRGAHLGGKEVSSDKKQIQSPVICLFRATVHGAEWEWGGAAPGPQGFWPPASISPSSLPTSHMCMQLRDQGEQNERLWWAARTAGNRNHL